MATLTDRYVQALIKYNDSLTEQKKKDVQKQYNAWAQKKSMPVDVSATTQDVEPVSDMAQTDTSADGGLMLGSSLMKKVKNAISPENIEKGIKNVIPRVVNTVLGRNTEQKTTTREQNEKNIQVAQGLVGDTTKKETKSGYELSKEYIPTQNYSTKVSMDDNGNADIDSIKDAARDTKKGREKEEKVANAINAFAELQSKVSEVPGLIYGPNTRAKVALSKLEDQVDKSDISTKISYYGQKWLDPNYKMTKDDIKKFKQLQDEWANGDNSKYQLLGLYGMSGGLLPHDDDMETLDQIFRKSNTFMAGLSGVNKSLSGLENTAGAIGKGVGKATGQDWIADEVDRELAENNRNIQNAEKQHKYATGAGYLVGTAAQYALADFLLGGISAGNSVYKAAKNAKDIAKLEGAGKGIQAAQAARAGLTTYGTNVAKQMIPDLLIDTSGNIAMNVANGADAETIAKDAGKNIAQNLLLNMAFEGGAGLIGAGVGAVKNARTEKALANGFTPEYYARQELAKEADDLARAVSPEEARSLVENNPVSADVVDSVAQNAVKPVDEVAQNVAEDARFIADDTKNIDNVTREIAEDTGLRPDELTIVPETRRAVQTAEPEIPEGMKERSYARNIREGNVPTDETIQDVFTTTPRTYKPISNAQTRADVDAIMANGTDYAQRVFDGIKGSADARFAPLGHNIAQEYAKAGRYADAARVLDEVSEELTKAGQMNQAAIITMVKDDPMTALNYLERQVDKLNVEGAKKYKDKWHELSLTDDEIKAMSQIKPGDEKAIKEMWEKVGDRIAMEYPSSMMEKLLEARKVAMLLNSRTLIRNFGANVPTLGMRWLSDRFASLGEHGYRLINPDYKMTQSLTGGGRASHKLANEVYNGDYVKALREGTSGKYEIPELKNEIFKRKTMYKGTALDKLAESAGLDIEGINKKLFGRSNVHSLGETTRNLTYKLLDIGDSPFMRKNFEDRLSSYISANGIKSMADVPQEAIDIAWQEALKATYKDNSWAVKAVSGFRNAMRKIPGVGEPLAQAVIPFVQAPGNIAARMVDYSAIGGTSGAVKVLSQIAKGAKNADVNVVREGIDQLSKGMTGTALVALGVALYNSGIITGSYSSDKDQRQFQKQSGYREYALHVGDKYYTYDWAQPAAENLLIGTILADAIKRSDEYDSDMLKYYGIEDSKLGRFTGAVKQGAKESINSWFNESPLQGLADLMKGDNRSYDTDIAGNIWDTAVVDFASSFIPSSFNALAKTTDNSQRQTRDYTNEYASFINAQKAKIPGLSDDLPAKYDTWGREMTYGDTKADAFFNRFINPGDTGVDKHDPLDEEINRLFNETQDAKVFPQVAPTSANGEKLTAEEYSQYQQNMGQRSHEMVEDLMKSDFYEKMTDEQKADMLAKLYNGSKALTENELYDKDYSDKVAKLYKEGGMDNVISYYSAQNALEQNGLGTGSDKVNAYVEGAKDPWKAAKDISKATDMMKSTGLLDKDAKQPTADLMDKYEELGYKGLKDYGNAVKEARKAGVMSDTSTTMPESVQEFYDNYGVDGVKDYASAMDTLRKNGLLKEDAKSLPKEVREIYAQSGMKGVNDYVTIETNQKGASYSGYQKIQGQIPYLTATEYNNIYNKFSVPSENGNYNATFSKDAELIPYLTSRTWSNDNELNIYAHALAPSVEGTWHIKNNQLYYNKPSVEKWNG